MVGNASALDRSASFNCLSHSAALSFGPSCACLVFNSTNFVETFVANRGRAITLPVRVTLSKQITTSSPFTGYCIDYEGRSVLLSGDTRFNENVIKHGEGVDLLIHEVFVAGEGGGALVGRSAAWAPAAMASPATELKRTKPRYFISHPVCSGPPRPTQ